MLNYENTIVVVAYHFNIECLIELNTEASSVFQVRPITQPPVHAIVIALRDPIIVGHFLCS